jgi:hypothetical protein
MSDGYTRDRDLKRARTREYRQRNYSTVTWAHNERNRVTVPDDIERRELTAPCFSCESRGPCRHRVAPW